jgi:hypothetical protein
VRHDRQPVDLLPEWLHRCPRKGSPRCGFCGLRAHGTRDGINRCARRALRLAVVLEVEPRDRRFLDDDRFVYPYLSAWEVLGREEPRALDVPAAWLIPSPHAQREERRSEAGDPR